MTVLQQVGVGGIVAGGLTATAIGGYNLAHSEAAKYREADANAELNDSLTVYTEPLQDSLKPVVDRYIADRDDRLDDWMGAAIGLGVTGLAATGLGVASLMTKNPNTAATLRNLGLAAGVGSAAAGALTWKQYSDTTSEQPAERMQAAAERRFKRYDASQARAVAAPVTGSVGALDTIAGPTIARVNPTTAVLADQYRAQSMGAEYSVGQYAGVINQIVGAAGTSASGLRDDLGMIIGADGAASVTDVARALDINGDGMLVATERQPIWPVLDIAKYAGLRDTMVLPGEDPRIVMAELMQDITGSGPMSSMMAPPELGALAALSLDVANHVGVDQGTGAPIDWYEVASRAESILEQG